MELMEFPCTICKVIVLGITNYTRHVESLEHANRIRLKNFENITDEDKVCCSSNADSMQQVINGSHITRNEESMDVGRKHSSLKCELCHKQFTGNEPYQQHLKSAGHKKKLDPNHSSVLGIRCSICDKDYFETYEQHVITNIHKKKVIEKELNQKENPFVALASQYKTEYKNCGQLQNNEDADFLSSSQAGASLQDNSQNSIGSFICGICDKYFSGSIPYLQHMSSSVHTKKLRDIEILNKMKTETCTTESVLANKETVMPPAHTRGAFHCDVCDKNCSGPIPYEQHMNSMQHKKKVQDKKMLQKLLTTGSNDQVDFTSERNSSVCSNFNASNTGKVSELVVNLNKFQQPSNLKCDICDKSFTGSVPYQQHIVSAAHQKKILQKSSMTNGENKNIVNNSLINSSPKNENFDSAFYCKICDKQCSGSVPFNQHKISDAHCKKERLLKIEKDLKDLDSAQVTLITEHASVDSMEDDSLEQVERKVNMSPTAQQADSDLIMGDVLKDLYVITPETLNVTTFNVNENIVFDVALR